MSLQKRLKAIIDIEGANNLQFAQQMNIEELSIQRYITGREEPDLSFLAILSRHDLFKKYTIWLLTGEVEPKSGQVCPVFSTQEQCNSIKKR